jgi:hypothetical protein
MDLPPFRCQNAGNEAQSLMRGDISYALTAMANLYYHSQMHELIFLIAFLFAASLFFVFRQKRAVSPSDFFFAAFFVQYGIHASLTPGFLQLREYASSDAATYEQYLLGLTVAYLGIIFGFVFGRRVFRVNIGWRGQWISSDREHIMWIYLFSVSLLILMVFVQGPGLPVTAEYVKFFVGMSGHEYTHIRRVMFEGNPYLLISEMLRYSLTALIFSGWVYFLVHRKRFHVKALSMAGLLLIFIVAGMQLNKFPFVYFISLIVLVVFYDKFFRGTLSIRPRFYAQSVLVVVAGLFLVYFLYIVQYRTLLMNNEISFSEIFELLIYRVFYASNDALRLWFEAFPSVIDYLGFNNIGLFRLFGFDYVNVTVVLPELFLGEVLTSFQAGFIGSAYAGFGILGIIIVSILVGIIVSYADFFAATRRTHFGKVVVASVLSLNLIALTSREFHTALLSGGVLSAIMVAGVGGVLGVHLRIVIGRGALLRRLT